ncbi:transposase [Elysia marginata]|uniref:Transposase n=1 Tax=Elysia marginata TaxID=1093978 RepID=A0AAV4EFD5_9GAST|nr:transposase [Elysia marginata]
MTATYYVQNVLSQVKSAINEQRPKDRLAGRNFDRIQDLAKAVNSELRTMPEEDYQGVFRKWQIRLKSCIESHGDVTDTNVRYGPRNMPLEHASNGEVSYSVTNLDSALTMLMAVYVYGEVAVEDTKQIALEKHDRWGGASFDGNRCGAVLEAQGVHTHY